MRKMFNSCSADVLGIACQQRPGPCLGRQHQHASKFAIMAVGPYRICLNPIVATPNSRMCALISINVTQLLATCRRA